METASLSSTELQFLRILFTLYRLEFASNISIFNSNYYSIINVSLHSDSRLSSYRYVLNVEIRDEENDWKNCKGDSDTR